MLAGFPPRADSVSGHGRGACAFSVNGFQKKKMRCEMKGRLVAFVGVFCIAILVVAGANAGKKDKPPKPGEPEAECITFLGPDLVGSQEVEGCCPNAGPWPAYQMYLPNGLNKLPPDTFDGQLYINRYGAGRNQKYIVQFWSEDIGMGMEIIGGVIDHDKKNKVLTVTFTDEPCWDFLNETPLPNVSFTLVRTSDLTYCE